MGVHVNSVMMFALADALGITIEVEGKTDRVTGKTSRNVHFGKIPVEFNLSVVSSQLRANSYMLLLRCSGNLALFAYVEPNKSWDHVTIHLLNLAKMDKIDGWLEAQAPATPAEAVAKLQPAIVRGFSKVNKTQWAVSA